IPFWFILTSSDLLIYLHFDKSYVITVKVNFVLELPFVIDDLAIMIPLRFRINPYFEFQRSKLLENVSFRTRKTNSERYNVGKLKYKKDLT
ncbi:hypothetical protein, partial [Leptospira interrogans]|uniref:hypothetical protein n=1 Tax=Leptospira interrogans TaxID=173 RepID=UPI001D148638